MKKDILQIIQEISRKLLSEYIYRHLAEQSAWQLLELVTDASQAHLFAQKELALTQEQEKKLDRWIYEITQEHKPIQYIIGSVPFLDITIHVKPPVLIPRPETEEWVHTLIEKIKLMSQITAQPECRLKGDVSKADSETDFTILDLCTGSGCIALALAKAFPQSHVYASDISHQALALAQENAKVNHISNITYIQSDIYANIPHHIHFDIIVANPPYIPEQAYKNLDPSVAQWEDKHALVAADNGLEIITTIINNASYFLKKNIKNFPQVWIEIDIYQAQKVSQIFQQAGFKSSILSDFSGHGRVAIGTLL